MKKSKMASLGEGPLQSTEIAAKAIAKQELAQAAFAGMREYLRTARGARLAGAGSVAMVENFGDRIMVIMDGAKFVWTFGIEA